MRLDFRSIRTRRSRTNPRGLGQFTLRDMDQWSNDGPVVIYGRMGIRGRCELGAGNWILPQIRYKLHPIVLTRML